MRSFPWAQVGEGGGIYVLAHTVHTHLSYLPVIGVHEMHGADNYFVGS